MKKFLKSFFVIVLCCCACLGFAGCNNTKWSKTTNDNALVQSNGGMVLYHDGWVYFINGTKTNNEENNSSANVQSAIYRAKANDQGEIIQEVKVVDEKEVRTIKKLEKVVTSLVGFDDGSIFIFGDYLYYATPSKGKNKEGEMLIGKTEFRRYDLKNKNDQLVYVTQSSDDTIQYSYYKQGDSLNLVVYEKNKSTLTSLKIGSSIKQNFKKKDVKSAVMSEENCQNLDDSANTADAFIYYTLNYDENSSVRKGVRVYSITPDGKTNKKLSEGLTLSLMAVRGDHLIYADDNYLYAEKITDATTGLDVSTENIIAYSTYKDQEVLFVENAGRISVLVFDNLTFRLISWVDGELSYTNIETLDENDKITFIGVSEDWVVYQLDKLIYKIKFQNFDPLENHPIQLSTTKFDASSDDSNSLLVPEIYNGYIYAMATDSDSKTTYLYRVNILTPEERGLTEEDGSPKDIEEAEFIGVKE